MLANFIILVINAFTINKKVITLFETIIKRQIGSEEQNYKREKKLNEKLSIKKTNVTMMDWKREICVLFGKNCIISSIDIRIITGIRYILVVYNLFILCLI